MLEGARVAGNREVEVRHPEDLNPGEDLWTEYKVDLISVHTMDDWRAFRKKWFAWLDEQTLRDGLPPGRLVELKSLLRMWYHERIDAHDYPKWMMRLLQPQIFVTVEMCRTLSVKGEPYPWDKTFVTLCVSEFIQQGEDGRLFVNEAKLAPEADEKILTAGKGDHIQHALDSFRDQAFEMDYAPPDWSGAVDRALEKTHQPTKIITH